MDFYCNNKYKGTYSSFSTSILEDLGFTYQDVYFIQNGKITTPTEATDGRIHIVPKLRGGKGGFGSMLRAIGAQIEKTTNREACRDLSGRRLRDINEEKRLQNWIDQQAEREKDAADRKQRKLERLCEKPKYEFRDARYEKEREALPDRVESAVEQGMQAAQASGSGTVKRKLEEVEKKKKKKRKMWLEDDMSELSSSDDENQSSESNEENSNKSKIIPLKETSPKITEL